MGMLGSGLSAARHHVDALSVKEARLSLMLRVGAPKENILVMQGNIASTLRALRRFEEAIHTRQDVYSGRLKLSGEEHVETLRTANNYAVSLVDLQRSEEAKSLLLKTIPVVRRVLGEENRLTLKMRSLYARALYLDTGATLDDLRKAVTTLEDTERTARRVFGGAHPLTKNIEWTLRKARAAFRSHEASTGSA